MNSPTSLSPFMTLSCGRYWSISLRAISIKMKILSYLIWSFLTPIVSPASSLQTQNTSSSIFYSTQCFSSFSTKSFLSSTFDFSFLAEGHKHHLTPWQLHLHWSGNETWVWRMYPDPARLQRNKDGWLLVSVTEGRLCVSAHTQHTHTCFLFIRRYLAWTWHLQENGVGKGNLILKCHFHTIISLTNISKCPKK